MTSPIYVSGSLVSGSSTMVSGSYNWTTEMTYPDEPVLFVVNVPTQFAQMTPTAITANGLRNDEWSSLTIEGSSPNQSSSSVNVTLDRDQLPPNPDDDSAAKIRVSRPFPEEMLIQFVFDYSNQ